MAKTVQKSRTSRPQVSNDTRPAVRKNTINKDIALTGDALIAFISGTQTNIGRETFYNMSGEQRQALSDMHLPIMTHARPFYTLMSLSNGMNDVNKLLIAWNLIEQTITAEDTYTDQKGLKHKYSPQTWWENEIILQSFEKMSVPRVFEFLTMMQENRVKNKRAMYLIHEFLRRKSDSWPLWAIKYRTDFKRVLRHAHVKSNVFDSRQIQLLSKIWRYLRYNESEACPQLILDYIDVQNGNQAKLAKLPATVAEGFMTKFNLSTEDFWKLYKDEGGQFTAKEKRTKSQSVAKAGVSTEFDMTKARLFDLLIYLKAFETLPASVTEIKKLLDKKAKEAASSIGFKLENTAVILDTSLSMYGTKEQPYHPMLKGMAISLVLKQVSNGFKEFRTNGGDELFPHLKNQSNYADALVQALKEGFQTIIIVGDGYENAPFEGAFHQILFAYKKKLDKDNKLMVVHFNPVFASEAMDVRSLSSMASSIGVREVSGLNESMFLAVAKHKPMLAISKFVNNLLSQQNDRAKSLMPEVIKQQLTANDKLLIQ